MSKATQIKIFADESQANSFMLDVEVIDVRFIGKMGYTGAKKWMVIYKEWIPDDHQHKEE